MRARPQPSPLVWLLPLLVVGAAVAGGWTYWSRTAGDPDQLWAQAQLELRSDQLDRAAATLARLSKLRPPTPADWMLRAQVAVSQGKIDDALADLAKIADADPLA